MMRLDRAWHNCAALIAAATLTVGCAQTSPERAKAVSQPKTRPTTNLTSFSESLRCMDNLFVAHGVRDIVITSQGIPDATGEISTGTKDMLISAVSRMSARSNAFIFVDFDQTQYDINALQNLVGFTDDFLVPNYYIRGAITQLDEQVISESMSAGISLPFADAGGSMDQVISMVSVDLNMGDLLTRQILPWASSNNSIAVRRAGQSADAGGTIQNIELGLNFNVSMNQSEGMHQAIRTLVDLSAVEVLGKLTQVPYWRCLQIDQTSPVVTAQARDWYDKMDDPQRVTFFQRALAGNGIYRGPIDGTLSPDTRDAIGAYQASNGLIADGRVTFDTYASLISGDLALGRMPAPDEAAAQYVPSSAAVPTPEPQAPPPPPLAMALVTDKGSAPTYGVGEAIIFAIETNRDAFAYCYYQDALGNIARIFPNRFQPDALVKGGEQTVVPGRSAPFQIVFEKAGAREEIACIAAELEIGVKLPDALKMQDLTPLPVRTLDDVETAFDGLGEGQVVSARLPITVGN
jgi:curli biogenesis system outer membrane secretion channel CsgG